MNPPCRIGLAALAILLAIAPVGCGEDDERSARADREQMADDLMQRMNELEEATADARHVVILTDLGETPENVRSMLREGRWLNQEQIADLENRLPLEIASELTESEADRLAQSLRNHGGAVQIATTPTPTDTDQSNTPDDDQKAG